jgi:hypothetical protein
LTNLPLVKVKGGAVAENDLRTKKITPQSQLNPGNLSVTPFRGTNTRLALRPCGLMN